MLAVAAGLAMAGGLAGCAPTVSLSQPPHAGSPQCAEIMVRLPHDLAEQSRVWTNAQSTAAWGTPTKVVFACGVTPPGPTTLKCIDLGGVDWVVDESQQPDFRITTFGRTPAVQVFVDAGQGGVDPNAVLTSLGTLVGAHTTRTAQCTNPTTVPDS